MTDALVRAKFYAVRKAVVASGPNVADSEPHLIQLEWHRQFRSEDLGLTSHSWLQVFFSDGSCSTLEFLGDRGFVESRLTSVSTDTGTLYADRLAFDFTRISADDLRCFCSKLARAHAYSTVNFNCHHWSLAVWNQFAPVQLRTATYPDQRKANIVRQIGLAWLFEPPAGNPTGLHSGLLTSHLLQCLPLIV